MFDSPYGGPQGLEGRVALGLAPGDGLSLVRESWTRFGLQGAVLERGRPEGGLQRHVQVVWSLPRPSGRGAQFGCEFADQPEPEKVRISLQVLPPGISYVVTQQDRAVVVKVVRTE